MKNTLYFFLVLLTFACSNKKSEIEILKEELDDQKQLIEEQNDKILNLENKQEEVNHDYDYENNEDSSYPVNEENVTENLDISVDDFVSFITMKNDEIENILKNKQWVYVEKGEKYIISKKYSRFFKYRNQKSDSEIEIKDFSGIRKVAFRTINHANFKNLLNKLSSNNYKLVDPNYEMGRQFDLTQPEVGQKKLINSTAELYSDGVNNITINYNVYAIVNQVENDSEGTYTYSRNSQYNSYEFNFK